VENVALTHLKNPILIESKTGEIVVNFHEELAQIIKESKYLDQLGWKIPEIALSVTLQVHSCAAIINTFNNIILGGEVSQIREESECNVEELLFSIGKDQSIREGTPHQLHCRVEECTQTWV
jgi:hypothetical protein